MDGRGRVSIALAGEADEDPRFLLLSLPGSRLESFLEVLFGNFASAKLCALMRLKALHWNLPASGSSLTLVWLQIHNHAFIFPVLRLQESTTMPSCKALWNTYPAHVCGFSYSLSQPSLLIHTTSQDWLQTVSCTFHSESWTITHRGWVFRGWIFTSR